MTTPIKPADVPAEVHRLRRLAWLYHGVAMLDIDKVGDIHLRTEIANLCDGIYGLRIYRVATRDASRTGER